MSNLSNQFFIKLKEICNSIGMKPEDVLLIMSSESGLNPSAGNSIASGLIAATTQTLNAAGFKGSHKDFAQLPDFKQLDYIQNVLKSQIAMNGGRPFPSAAHYYCANFLPAVLSRKDIQNGDSSAILAEKNPTASYIPGQSVRFSKIVYDQNPGLDQDKDGKITFGDLQRILESKKKGKLYQDALSAFYKANNSQSNSEQLIKSDIKEPSNNAGDIMKKILETFPKQATKIVVLNPDKHCALEFCKVASMALFEELNLSSSIYSDDHHNHQIVIEKKLNDYQKESVAMVLESVSESFNKLIQKTSFKKLAFVLNEKCPIGFEIKENQLNSITRQFSFKLLGDK